MINVAKHKHVIGIYIETFCHYMVWTTNLKFRYCGGVRNMIYFLLRRSQKWIIIRTLLLFSEALVPSIRPLIFRHTNVKGDLMI